MFTEFKTSLEKAAADAGVIPFYGRADFLRLLANNKCEKGKYYLLILPLSFSFNGDMDKIISSGNFDLLTPSDFKEV